MQLNKVNWQEFGRIIVFIDAANVIYSCRDLDWRIKYRKLKRYFEEQTTLIDIYFYTARHDNFAGLNKLLCVLAEIGIQVKARQLKIYHQNNGAKELKGNVDGELIVDMIKFSKRYDTAVLMSGDGDFVHAVDYVIELGKKVVVISSRGHISKDLINAASVFLYLDGFKKHWSFDKKNHPARNC